MDLGFLDKSSSLTPLLVRLYDSQKLYQLARAKKPEARSELADAVCDLLEMELSAREGELVADVLIELMRQAENDFRQALAERLAPRDDVPLRLVLQLANDRIEVAAPLLRCSPVLGDLDLVYIIRSKGPEYWRAVAARRAMSGQVMEILAASGDFETAFTLVENRNITLTERTLTALADMARGEEALAAPLLRRDEITADIAASLYEFVGRELKAYILEHHPVDHTLLAGAVDDIVSELARPDEKDEEILPSDSIRDNARMSRARGLLTPALMIAALRRGQIPAFIAYFSEFTGLSPRTVREILAQPSGQGLAIACKGYNIQKPDFISIYLLTNRLRNRGRTADIRDVNRAVSYYARIDSGVAASIMKNSAGC